MITFPTEDILKEIEADDEEEKNIDSFLHILKGFSIAGNAARADSKKKASFEELQTKFKLYHVLSRRIAKYEATRIKLLTQELLPPLRQQLKYLKNVCGSDQYKYNKEKKKYLLNVAKNDKNAAIAFAKKRLREN